MPVPLLEEKAVWTPTSKYEYQNYTAFEKFNPVQSQALKYVDSDNHLVFMAQTSSGKTIAAELIAGKTLAEGKRIIYLSPLKALAEERFSDWSSGSHPWSDYSRIMMTGDYCLTPERELELLKARVILATYEMFGVRCRRQRVEFNQWLSDAGCLIVDEAHFLGSEGRGDHLENAIALFTKWNPDCRIVFLSATLLNYKEIAGWLKRLSTKPVESIVSHYRPCKLQHHFIPYRKPRGPSWQVYRDTEQIKIQCVIEKMRQHHKDQWLVFVHSKSAGKKFLEAAQQAFPGKLIAFHNADVERQQRLNIEDNFRERKLHYLIATSTLAFGVNLPARRVAILGLERGFEEVDPLDVIQECGRAGRPKYDTQGDAYIVLEERQLSRWQDLLDHGIRVMSKLPQKARFHLIGEFTEHRVNSKEELPEWANRTLAVHQGVWSDLRASEAFDDLIKHKLVQEVLPDGDLIDINAKGILQVTKLGRISSYYYFDPLQVAGWKYNLCALSSQPMDAELAWLVANAGTEPGFMPKELRAMANEYTALLRVTNKSFFGDRALASATCLYYRLQGDDEALKPFIATWYSTIMDIDRIMTCIDAIVTQVLGKRRSDYWERLIQRFKHGISWQQAELCLMPGIGREFSSRLMEEGISSIQEFFKKRSTAKVILPSRAYDSALDFAKLYLKRKQKDVQQQGNHSGTDTGGRTTAATG